jgi:hypothetical protein
MMHRIQEAFLYIYLHSKQQKVFPSTDCHCINPNRHRRTQHLSSRSNMHFPKENRSPVNIKIRALCYISSPCAQCNKEDNVCGREITWKKSARKVIYRKGR